jgi:hypothetical protein
LSILNSAGYLSFLPRDHKIAALARNRELCFSSLSHLRKGKWENKNHESTKSSRQLSSTEAARSPRLITLHNEKNLTTFHHTIAHDFFLPSTIDEDFPWVFFDFAVKAF